MFQQHFPIFARQWHLTSSDALPLMAAVNTAFDAPTAGAQPREVLLGARNTAALFRAQEACVRATKRRS